MAPTKDEIFTKVQAALVDALGVDEEDVTPTATMVGDLGAESIDFLDIVFKLEKAFSIEIPRKDLAPEDILTSTEFVKDGKVSPAGMVGQKKAHPGICFNQNVGFIRILFKKKKGSTAIVCARTPGEKIHK